MALSDFGTVVWFYGFVFVLHSTALCGPGPILLFPRLMHVARHFKPRTCRQHELVFITYLYTALLSFILMIHYREHQGSFTNKASTPMRSKKKKFRVSRGSISVHVAASSPCTARPYHRVLHQGFSIVYIDHSLSRHKIAHRRFTPRTQKLRRRLHIYASSGRRVKHCLLDVTNI